MTMTLRAGWVAACVFAFAASAQAGELKVTMHDGRVTIIADNVPVRQILAEWARVGQARIVGADRMPGGPVTLRLEDVPERQALDILLRAASGFMVAERPEPVATLARFDRVMILPTSSAPSGPPAQATGPGGRGGAANQTSPSMLPTAPQQPVADEPAEPESEPDNADVSNDGDARPPETNFDYANPQQFLQRRLEQLQQQQQQMQQGQAPAMFPGTVSPYGQAGTPTATAPTGVAGAGATAASARPGEIIKPPQPTMVNPYGIPMTPAGPGAPPMQPDRAKYANPYQPPPPPPDR